MKVNILDTLSIAVLIVEIIWRLSMERISAPQWMHHVEWGLIILIFVLVILHFVLRRKENKQNKGE